MNVITTCPVCGQETVVVVEQEDYDRWLLTRELIQDVMPYLSADQAEMLKTGTCPACWDKMFKQAGRDQIK